MTDLTWGQENYERAKDLQQLIRENIIYIANQRGLSITGIYNTFESHGIKMSRTSFYKKREDKQFRFVGLIYLSAMSRILNVPTWLLLSDDVESDFRRFK